MNKNKLHMMIAIIVGVAIITIGGGVVFNQMEKNHQANKLVIEKCFENFDVNGSVVINKKNFWSPATCEKGN